MKLITMDQITVIYKILFYILIVHVGHAYAQTQDNVLVEKVELSYFSTKEDLVHFKKVRNRQYVEYRRIYDSALGSKLRKWDKEILRAYVVSTAKSLIEISLDKNILKILNRFLESPDEVNLVWNTRKHKKYGNGSYTSSRQEISLEILPPSEFALVLVHELTHLYDKHLALARNLAPIENEIRKFKHKPFLEWTNEEKILFGKYWFLQTSYIKNYKEFLPKLNSCRLKRELFSVGEGELPCEELIAVEMNNKYGKPHYFWSKSKWQYDLVIEYIEKWHVKHGIIESVY